MYFVLFNINLIYIDIPLPAFPLDELKENKNNNNNNDDDTQRKEMSLDIIDENESNENKSNEKKSGKKNIPFSQDISSQSSNNSTFSSDPSLYTPFASQ